VPFSASEILPDSSGLINDGPPGKQLSLRLPPARAYTSRKPLIVFSQIAHNRLGVFVGKTLKNFAAETDPVASRMFAIGCACFGFHKNLQI
jgi:hypothetical protein